MRKLHVVPDDVPDMSDRRTPPLSVKRYLDSGTISDTDTVMAVPSATSKFNEMVTDGRVSDGASLPNGFSYLELSALLYEGRIYYDDNRFIAVVEGTVPEAETEAPATQEADKADGARMPRCIDTPHQEFRLDPQPAKNYGIWKKGQKGSVQYVRREMIRYLINLGIVADDNGEFLRWDGSIYRPIDESEVRNEIYDALFESDIELSISEMCNTLAQLASNARFSRKDIPDSFYDQSQYDGEIVAFANGWYNVSKDEWVRPTPNLFITRRFHATYDPSMTSHSVADVVKGIIPDDDTRNFWYEMCGYIMFSSVISIPAMFVMYGPGNTGKTALQEALRTAIGEDNVSHLDMGQLCGRFTLSGIENKLLNVCGETGSAMVNGYTVADGELLKKLSEGQTVTVDKKHAQPHSMTNTAKLLFVSNSVPNFGDTSSGLYRRLFIIPCRVEQKWEDQIYHALCDETAQTYLVNEFLKGYLRFEARGRRFVPSAEMREEHVRFKAQESMMDFLLAFFGTADRDEVPAKLDGQYAQDVYRDYKSYVAETGGSALSQRKFNEKLRNEFGVGGRYINAYREMPDGSRRTKLLQYTSGSDCEESDERRRLALQAGPARRRLPPVVAGGAEQAHCARACRGGHGPLGCGFGAGRHR